MKFLNEGFHQKFPSSTFPGLLTKKMSFNKQKRNFFHFRSPLNRNDYQILLFVLIFIRNPFESCTKLNVERKLMHFKGWKIVIKSLMRAFIVNFIFINKKCFGFSLSCKWLSLSICVNSTVKLILICQVSL